MSEKPISPLRQRMLEDMSLRGFTPDTQRDYVRAVKKLAAFFGRSPDTATAEDLRASNCTRRERRSAADHQQRRCRRCGSSSR